MLCNFYPRDNCHAVALSKTNLLLNTNSRNEIFLNILVRGICSARCKYSNLFQCIRVKNHENSPLALFWLVESVIKFSKTSLLGSKTKKKTLLFELMLKILLYTYTNTPYYNVLH